jgi:hypothetical protein
MYLYDIIGFFFKLLTDIILGIQLFYKNYFV